MKLEFFSTGFRKILK